ncbi:exosome complex component RRP46 isoform X2 [Eurytemora carolleeae]|uniref:exosome complex component RRP46 isoform X2 n=1 Tax=Eurytemora carolleeae TaxID=1294199 RepID=UPI000C78BBBC|nr:exosome complex component RRP46 isoform X2 [Eurytemora carolleeae]|eukprot:XP_023322255.1 exosome complex component RRP46-like isoform X2 [Eurytemora affinis]
METDNQSSLRPMFCELGAITRADGSCVFSCGDTNVACAVYGPGEVKPNREIIDRSSVEVVYRSKVGTTGVQDKKRELFLERTCQSCIVTYRLF